MIAIKQAKFKPSNKIQENQIKITTKPSNVAQTNNHHHHRNPHQEQQQRDHEQDQVSLSENNEYQLCREGLACEQQDEQVKSPASDKNQRQQQINETRSEKRKKIDGATTASAAAPIKSSSSAAAAADRTPTKAPSSTATTSSLSTAATATANVTNTNAAMAVKQARQQQQQAPATSLTTASAKIQQRQQKFLAAAAKSATSPHFDQNLMVIKQQAARTKGTSVSAYERSCCRIDTPVKLVNAAVDDPFKSAQAVSVAKTTQERPSMSSNACTCCQQVDSESCCQSEDKSAQCERLPVVPLANKLCTTDGASSNKTVVQKSHLSEHRQQSQQVANSCERQTIPSKNATLDDIAGLKVLPTATVLSNTNGVVSGRCNGGVRTSSGNKLQQQVVNGDRYRSAWTPCNSLQAAIDSTDAVAATFDSCRMPTSTSLASSSISVSDVDSSDRKFARSSHCDANNLAANPYHHQQQQLSSQNKREVRQSGENKDNDDNINIKNTIKHNNHYHYHHYYNHSYLGYHHRFQQQQQPQNHFHLQYQQAQQQQQTINSSNQTATQLNQQQQQHPPVMAHYKFHNDCQSSVLTYEQVKRLDFVMDQTVPIHGRGNSPTLYVKLKELIRLVKYKLQHEHSIEVRDVRLNGGAASYVLAPENSKYNDLDLVFGTDLSNEDRFDVIRDVVLECLMEFYPDKPQAAQSGDKFTTTSCGDSFGVASSNKRDTNQTSNDEQVDNTAVDDDDEDEESCEQQSRSQRSSSFESDNINVTTNELDDDGSDDEDDVIVRIDSDDSRSNYDSKIDEIGDAIKEQMEKTETGDKSILGSVEQDANPLACCQDDDPVHGGHKVTVNDVRATGRMDYSAQCYQYNQMPLNNCASREAYVHKMVKVNDDDRWSLISLGVQQSETNIVHQRQQASTNCAQRAPFAPINTDYQQRAHPMPMCCDNAQTSSQGQDHSGSQPKQFPNSIELKFVDRMRRKFEFSVDSFQIILDSLIQFYDFAPQSTMTIQRTTSGTHPNPLGVNSSPLLGLGQCLQCDREQGLARMRGAADSADKSPARHVQNIKSQAAQSPSKKHAERRHCETLSDSRSFYELPLEPGNSLSNSSVASSSGCSSSSSVVSSSSSSLSCDEDQEDLYCDVDNSPSSSASTSSLLSSTTTSGTGSPCDPSIETKSHQSKEKVITNGQHNQAHVYRRQSTIERQCNDCASSVGGLNDFGGLPNFKANQAYQVAKNISNYKQHHVNIKSFRENLCNYGTSKISSCAVISENFYPTVIGRSEYGNFKEALYHLEKKLIATRSPEEIRGGGLLKYCNLLVKNYKPTNVYQIRTLERYMCSRFFIDFSDLNQQRAKLESYLSNHFSDDPIQKYNYLTILHNVVRRSTVCLMNHELRLTLNMITELAYNLEEQQAMLQQQQQQQQQLSQDQCVTQQAAPQQLPAAKQQDRAASQQPFCQSQRSPDKQGNFYHQQKLTTLQSGAYRVKLVNYALAKPVRS